MGERPAEEPLTPQQIETVNELLKTLEEKLQLASMAGATHAFNLGCSMSLLPILVLVAGAFFLFRNSWIAASVTAILALMASLGFANLVASIAKSRTMERTYERDILPEIERKMKQLELSRASFDRLAVENLPENAMLIACLMLPRA